MTRRRVLLYVQHLLGIGHLARAAALARACAERRLDVTVASGESPRDVQARLAPWLAQVAARKRPLVAVTHKGVIRAILALATGWDMTGTPPARLGWDCAHLFALAADGAPTVERLNLPLARS